jgi:hypothetical protein
MELIDDKGRLFGLVNVIDALVVLFVLAVLVAGVALVNPFASAEYETRYATVNFGDQQPFVAEQVDQGDYMALGNHNVTVRDVHVTPTNNGNATVHARIKIHGRLEPTGAGGRAFHFDGSPLRAGDSIEFETAEYSLAGSVRELDRAGDTLNVTRTPLFIETTAPTETANAVAVGDAYRVAGHDVGQVESLQRFPAGDQETQILHLGVFLQTIEIDGERRFGGTTLRAGESIALTTAEYQLTGTVRSISQGEPTLHVTQTPVVLQTTIPTDTADAITVGDEYRVSNQSVASVEAIQRYPTGDPTTQRLQIGVTLQTIDIGGERRFGTTAVRAGESLSLNTAEYSLQGLIVDVGAVEPPGERTTLETTVELRDSEPSVARGIAAGDAETLDGREIARITDVSIEPALYIVESEDGNVYGRDHPRLKDVTLTVTLQARSDDGRLRFHGQPLQEDREIVLDLGTITVQGRVLDIER